MADELKDMEMPEPTMEHKINMNRILREAIGGAFIPHPEADE